MQLTKKQKTILLVGTGMLCLAVFITTFLVVNTNQKKTSLATSFPPVPISEPTTPLVTHQNQAVTEIENALISQSVNETDLVQRLIADNKLSVDQSNWKDYLQDPSLTTESQITERKEELQTILTILGNQTPDPSPLPLPDPDPDPSPIPQPLPDLRPDNQWEGILWDIKKFCDTEVRTIAKRIKEIENKYCINLDIYELIEGVGLVLVKEPTENQEAKKLIPLKYYDYLDETDYPSAKSDKKEIEKLNEKCLKKLKKMKNDIINKSGEPLAGIDLEGVGMKKLQEITDGGEVSGLDEMKKYCNEEFEYKDLVKLSASPDGNCFLHSYCVFLTGESNLDLTLRLRVAMALELTTHLKERYSNRFESNSLAEILQAELGGREILRNGAWLSNFEIEILSYVLKRPLAVVSNRSGFLSAYYYNPEKIADTYPETWIIYNSGNHFQPLIKKS